MHRKRFAVVLFAVLALAADSVSPTPRVEGLWRTMDDKTQKPRGLVRIYEHRGQYFGKIVGSFDPSEARERCSRCKGELRDKPVIGLEILRDMRRNGNEYSGGTIIDPETGESYRCKMTLEDGGRRLLVRGYIGVALFGRTQVWTRYAPQDKMRETGE